MRRYVRSIPFHLSLLSIFLLVIVGLSGTLTWYNYQGNAATATNAAQTLLQHINQKIVERFQRTYDPIFILTETLSSIPAFQTAPAFGTRHPALSHMLHALDNYEQIYSVYAGYDNGDFLQLVNLHAQPEFRSTLNGPEEAHFGLLTILASSSGAARQQWDFLDARGALLQSSLVTATTFDPRQRPWYIQNPDDSELKNSGLYIFKHIKKPGVTISHRLPRTLGGGVLGIDIPVGHLARFLQKQRFSPASQLILFHLSGHVIAHPDENRSVRVENDATTGQERLVLARIEDLNDPVLDELYARHQQGTWENGTIFTVADRSYIARITPVATRYAKEVQIALIVPLEEILGPIAETGLHSLLFALLVVVVTVPVIVFISLSVAKALRQLAEETRRIREFDLSEPVVVRSLITEIRQLTESVATMKNALQTFGQYIPKELVRQLIASGEAVGLVGERRELTLLFTDVADFTTMAEEMAPEQLTLKVSEYFRQMTAAIHAQGGTIDKYIGDAIMAFWNAPVRLPDHANKACLAALHAAVANNRLNGTWQQNQQAIMMTRFGLHSGDVVIGNIGSIDRMDYTAMGATVNLASRIEGLNKAYGTRILISDAVVQRIDESFVIRPVDTVVPKGATRPIVLFELMGVRDGPEALRVYPDVLRELAWWLPIHARYQERRWAETLAACEELLGRIPDHYLARVYQKRCQQFLLTPPVADWNGATVFHEK
ncbi:MAG: adenylate/guanylate cyclase domain-containing protein [Magnetococcales bacterium]|nr:adenylate/guanylate cyclase domain-containing protein [Magnetococcales bacterium]